MADKPAQPVDPGLLSSMVMVGECDITPGPKPAPEVEHEDAEEPQR